MNKELMKVKKNLYIEYDNIYRNAKKVSRNLAGLFLFLAFLTIGFLGNIEINPQASILTAVIECTVTLSLMGVCVHYMNKYSDMSDLYKDKATQEYKELLK